MATKDTPKVVGVGCGRMANNVHYPSVKSFDDVELVALCDVNEEALNATAEKYEVDGRYTDYKEMIEKTAPDAVYAIGQPHHMYDVWVWCLQQGLNLFIEKPLGLNLHQAEVLANLAEENDCITQVNFQRRGTPMVAMLRDEVLERGPIEHAVVEFYKSSTKPCVTAKSHMHDDVPHAADTLRWMCGGEVKKLHTVTRRVNVKDINFVSALVEFDNGATGTLTASWTSGRRIFRVQMHGHGVAVDAEHEGYGYLYKDNNSEPETFHGRKYAGTEENYIAGGFQARHREFADAIKAGTLPASHFGDALKTMQLIELILAQSALRGD